jgi:hypothetical protein
MIRATRLWFTVIPCDRRDVQRLARQDEHLIRRRGIAPVLTNGASAPGILQTKAAALDANSHAAFTVIAKGKEFVVGYRRLATSNEAGRVKGVFVLSFTYLCLCSVSLGTPGAFARMRCFTGRIISRRRRSLICVHPTRSARGHFIISVLPTNHLFDHCGP